jgi:hypothetical protein
LKKFGVLIAISFSAVALMITKPALAQVDSTSSTVSDAPPTGEILGTSTADTSTSASPATNSSTDSGITEVHVVGTKYIDYFTDGTTTTAYPGDPDIDANLAKPNAPIPTHEGMTWVHTTGQPLYDTPSGDLELGDYAMLPGGSIISNAPPFQSSTSTAAMDPTSSPAGDSSTETSTQDTTPATPTATPDEATTTTP